MITGGLFDIQDSCLDLFPCYAAVIMFSPGSPFNEKVSSLCEFDVSRFER